MLNDNSVVNNINETELYEETESSSLNRKVSVLFYEKNKLDSTEKNNSFQNETPKLKKANVSYIEKLITEEKALAEQKRWDELVAHLTVRMTNALKYFSVEDSELTSAERLAIEIERKYSSRILGEVLQNIYVKYNDYPNILIGICKSIGYFELNDVMPWGPTMLVGLLSHKNESVKEYAVAIVENWADIDLLPLLKNLDCASVWLKEYIQDVVSYLEECNVLRKEII